MQINQDTLERRVNNFATRSFRDVADRDYVAARLAYRAELIPQFMWSAQQAFEKYLKYILLVNRIPATNVGHSIEKALELTRRLPFELKIRPDPKRFLDEIAAYGEYRYLDVSYAMYGNLLVDLDGTVWELRRYCQIFQVHGKKTPTADQQRLMEVSLGNLAKSDTQPPNKLRLHGGFLEQVIDRVDHPARNALLWQNAYFGARPRRTPTAILSLQGANSPLALYPDMLDELLKYVKIPRKLEKAYRQHLQDVLADPSKRL